MNENESLETFIAKSNSKKSDDKDKDEKKVSLSKVLQTRRMIRDMQVLGCLILELFLPKKFIPLGGSGSSVDLKSRFALASSILEHELSSVPHCIRGILQVLLKHNIFQIDDSDRYPINDLNFGAKRAKTRAKRAKNASEASVFKIARALRDPSHWIELAES